MIIRKVNFSELKPLMVLKKESVDLSENSFTEYLGAFIDDKLVGVVGWQKIGSVLRFKSDGVLKEFRGKGVYGNLFRARENETHKIPRSRTTAFCTEKSLSMYLANGFSYKKRNKITFVERKDE